MLNIPKMHPIEDLMERSILNLFEPLLECLHKVFILLVGQESTVNLERDLVHCTFSCSPNGPSL